MMCTCWPADYLILIMQVGTDPSTYVRSEKKVTNFLGFANRSVWILRHVEHVLAPRTVYVFAFSLRLSVLAVDEIMS